jgi:hypothetical protein
MWGHFQRKWGRTFALSGFESRRRRSLSKRRARELASSGQLLDLELRLIVVAKFPIFACRAGACVCLDEDARVGGFAET